MSRLASTSRRLNLEPLEDRFLLAACHVVRLGDLNAGHDLGTGHARGSLRYCINFANNNPGPDTIDFKVTGTIQLTLPLPELASDMTITGPGADLLALRGPGFWWPAGKEGAIFTVKATVAISGLTITHSYNDSAAGGIRNIGGILMLKDCTVSDNRNYFADDGYGGAIANFGKMTISGCTISDNEVVFSEYNSVGGGIYNSYGSGVMQIINSTISGNYVDFGAGGGIYNEGSLDIRFSTITTNKGGIHHDDAFGGSLNLYNTIVAGNNGTDLEGSNYTGSANLIGGDSMLGSLQYNGGHTQTHALLPGSPAINAGDNSNAPEWDQRGPGFPRIVNGTIDIGAFEVQATDAPGATHNLAVLITADFSGSPFKSIRPH